MKNSLDVYKASGKTNLLMFDPEALTLVTDESSPLYDERVHLPIDERMVLNIMAVGVIQPISVKKNAETGATEVVTGRQRVKNAREANKRLAARGDPTIKVPATVQRADAVTLAGHVVSENEIRTADTPMGRAHKMAGLLSRGRTEADLALLFGCTPATVKSTLALLDCCAAVRNAVEAGKIGVGHALKLAKLESGEQREKVAELIAAGEGVKPREKAKAQRAVLGEKPSKPARFDLESHLKRQKAFSEATFGPGRRLEGVTDHIAKELIEVRESGGHLAEWVDVIILAFDGALRSGASPREVIDAIVAKQTKNEGRKWPDWRESDSNKAIEHDRRGEMVGVFNDAAGIAA